jgi:pyruvate dehydrogenase E2 component (dihydrolipoyllysine-residue acetyltransferase)
MGAVHSVTIPKWGLSMEKGRLTAWHKQVGDRVAAGDEICDIETDKISGGLEVGTAGVLRRQLAAEGDELPVGALVAVVADADVSQDEIDATVAAFQASFVPRAAAAGGGGPAPEKVDVGGRRIRYLRHGEGGEPALLLHGFGGDLGNWLFNHEALAEGRAVYAIDLPGHGESTKDVGAGTLEELAAVAAAFLDTVGVPAVHLVGHSMGGAVALTMAAAAPERVRSMSLVGSAGLGREINGAYLDGFVAAATRNALRPHLAQLFADEKLITRQLVDDVLKYKRLEGVESALRKLHAALFPGGAQSRLLRDALASARFPTLVIWGGKDRIIPASHAAGLPASVRVEVIPEAGHMVQMEAAGAVNRLLQAHWADPRSG